MSPQNIGRPKEGPSLKGRHFFLTVPHFESAGAGAQTAQDLILRRLKANQPQWQYLRWALVLETHTKDADKGTHLHLYVGFPRRCRVKLDRFDYLGKHGKLQTVRSYSSVLKYMTKEARPRANFDYVEDIMQKDFPRAVDILLGQGWTMREIYKQYRNTVANKNWQGYLRFSHYLHESAKIQAEIDKLGIRMITPELIKARLSDQQYAEYHSKDIYSRIVDLINDTVRYGCNRPHKAKALLLVGQPNTGKTTLGRALQRRMATFTFPDDGWWQGYQSDVFKVIIWNELNLRRFPYPTLLKFLQGLRMDLPIKGSHVTRSDNPLILLTSNLTLEQHICKRFSSQQDRAYSRANLAVRIHQVNIGCNPIFFLEKLLVSPTQDIALDPWQ